MGVRLIADPNGGNDSVAMYDSVSGFAFGPVFASEEDAEDFIEYARREYDRDVRQLPDEALKRLHESWSKGRESGE